MELTKREERERLLVAAATFEENTLFSFKDHIVPQLYHLLLYKKEVANKILGERFTGDAYLLLIKEIKYCDAKIKQLLGVPLEEDTYDIQSSFL